MERLEKLFELSGPDMEKIVESFILEMERGLAGEKSSLKMIPTYVRMPTGKEKGKFIAIDLGGTTFRVLELTLKGDRKIGRTGIMKFVLKKKYVTGSAELFFDFIADNVNIFLRKYKLTDTSTLDLGFTFSFPIRQTGIASGTLICWTKDFNISGVTGNDVVKLMREAFRRRGIKNIDIAALVNDTVGTLAAKSYEEPDCDLGVIIGTGTNACYPEKSRGRMVINIEWGNFNKLASTPYDRQLDEESDNPGQQMLEKMVSGMYLGRIAGLVLKVEGFKTEHMSAIEGDMTDDLRVTGRLLGRLGIVKSSLKERRMFKKVCGIVSCRAARISASCIAAIIRRMDPHLSGTHTVAVDGSVFEKHPTFSQNMENALKEIFSRKASRIRLALTKDGSGKGAAIIAAVAGKYEK